ncbi:hypothetical protein [uncultured Zhongshania sp.]|uniref:hypothetical protein n=1 Tax=uncultured Zhongshania sp. TaxID=1642288 RepID=UPI0030D8F58D|tara:strand:+ start:1962 stop:2159 length:198 start_codon:yes stop_codon:yes gene_type:complete
MAPYQYLAEAQPCGCDVVIYEDQCTLDTLKDFGTGLTCLHENEYSAVEVINPNNPPAGLKGSINL